MRDVIKIFAAGSILTAYALIAPTIVEAVPSRDLSEASRTAAPRKAFTQRLVQAGGDAPVSAVSGTLASRMDLTSSPPLPRFARYGGLPGGIR